MTVWVVNDAGHNFKDAYRFGDDLKIITSGRVNIFGIDRLVYDIKEKLQDFEPGDWILLSGNAVINIVVFGVLLQRYDTVPLLVYNAKEHKYTPREIELDQLQP